MLTRVHDAGMLTRVHHAGMLTHVHDAEHALQRDKLNKC